MKYQEFGKLEGVDTPQKLLNWMDKNIKYSHGANWKLQKAVDTMEKGYGDCHDQSAFEYWVFNMKWNGKYKPKCFFMINPSGSHTHTFLTFYDNKSYYWFEHAWNKYKGIHGPYKNLTQLKRDVLGKWCAEYGEDPNNTYIGRCKTLEPGLTLKEYCLKNVK